MAKGARASSLDGWVRDDVADVSAAKRSEATIRRVVGQPALTKRWLEHERRIVHGVHEEALRSESGGFDV